LGDTAIKNEIEDRLFSRLPQKPKLPAMTYKRASGTRVHSMDGASGLATARIQYDIWDKSYSVVKNIADLLRKRLDGFKGVVETDTIHGAFLGPDWDDYEGDTLLKLYRVSMDFEVHYAEATT